MELLTHLLHFLICSALIVVAWFVFLFFNDLIDGIQRGMVQGFLGSVNTVVLLAVAGIIIYYFALGFFTGILTVMILSFLIYSVKKALADFTTAKS